MSVGDVAQGPGMERFDFAEAAMDATMKVGARVRTCAFVSVCVCVGALLSALILLVRRAWHGLARGCV